MTQRKAPKNFLLEGGVLLDISSQAPSPSKDYVNLHVTTKEIHWHYWKINPRCLKPDIHVPPSGLVTPLEDFQHDLDFQSEVQRIFGAPVLEYLKNLCKGHINYFDRLKKPLQIYIMSFMELEDIAALSCVSKHFKEICESDQLWEHLVERFCDTISPDMRAYAQEVGWKQVFFTNKLQLQKEMRRQKNKSVEFCQS